MKAPLCPKCGVRDWQHVCFKPLSAVKSAIKRGRPRRDGLTGPFDKVAYMRAYMRKWRLARKSKGNKDA